MGAGSTTCCCENASQGEDKEMNLISKPTPRRRHDSSVNLQGTVFEAGQQDASREISKVQDLCFETIETNKQSKFSPDKIKSNTTVLNIKDGSHANQSLLIQDTPLYRQSLDQLSQREAIASIHTPTKDLTLDNDPDFISLPISQRLEKKLGTLFADVSRIEIRHLSNGWLYRGEVKGESPQGRGVMFDQAQTHYYLGLYQNGHPIYKIEHFDLSRGVHYIGLIKDLLFSGFGILSLPDGVVYEGEFSEGLYEGHGQLLFQDGHAFIGEFSKGKKQGEGMTVDAKGIIVERGRYVEDMLVQRE